MNKQSFHSVILFALCAMSMRALVAGEAQEDWKVALPGWHYEFPRDHRSHEGFRTEWWYFTGNVEDEKGRVFGYQLTFFRQGIFPSQSALPAGSRFFRKDFYFAHFAIASLADKRHLHAERVTRGAFGEAGNGEVRLAWNANWELLDLQNGSWRIQASEPEFGLDLVLTPQKAPVFHGANGVSQKAEGVGRASHYYSFTRMKTEGKLTFGGETRQVAGLSWFDQEWASNQLAKNQIGWDWFSIQFEDGTELMLYQMRTREGPPDPWSSGTFVQADGTSVTLKQQDYRLTPRKTARTPDTGTEYPVDWSIEIPKLHLKLNAKAAFPQQEMALQALAYWEGSIEITGTGKGGKPMKGRGYLEMTGYAAELTPLQSR